jgi:Anaphase-promoting complex, subunit 10 (APC10)
MNRRQWMSLLDADGVSDASLQAEIQTLRRRSAAARNDWSAPSARGARPRFELPEDDEDSSKVDTPRAEDDEGHGGHDRTGDGATSAVEDPMIDSATGEPLRDLSSLAVWSVSTAKPGNGVEQLLSPSRQSYWQSDGPQPHSISAQFSSKVKLCEVRLFLSFADDESYTPAILSIRVGSSFHDLRVIRRNKELFKPEGWVRIPLGKNSIDALEDWDDVSSLPSEEDDMEALTPGELAERDQRRRVRSEHRRRIAKEKAAAEKETCDSDTKPAKGDGPMESDNGQRLRDAVAVEKDRLNRRDRSFVRAHMIQIVIHTNHQNGRDSHVRQVKLLGPSQQVSGGEAPRFSSAAFRMYEAIR